MLLTLFYFILALLLLILVHEFGHFIVARWCGVKVLRFSFGFGKILTSWHDKRGTEFAWSAIPMGGYVKMLDEDEGEVPPDERHLAFNNKSVWNRIAIVFAGPLFNFIFAFIALWLVLILGIKSLAPIIDEVKPNSIAAQAGLTENQEIISFNGQPIRSWRDFQYVLMPLMGTHEPVKMVVKSLSNGQEKKVIFPLEHWRLDGKNPDVLDSFGIVPFVPKIPPIVGEVVEHSPAQAAGLKPGDVIQAMNGRALVDWFTLVDFVKQHPDVRMQLTISRQAVSKKIMVHLGTEFHEGKAQGLLGVRSQRVHWPAHWLRLHRENPIHALGLAFQQTVDLTGATFSLMGRLVMGNLPLQSISGPVGIAQGAGESGRSGLPYYLSFLALVSISLGVLNLLPIPMLDGGHLFYYIVEIIRRRPLSAQFKSIGTGVGLVFLVTLMIIALTNDLARLA